MTPSGFSIGTSLNTNASRSARATGESAVKKRITPRIINDAFDSPGCTRALRTTAGRFCSAPALPEKLVTVSSSHRFPASVVASCRLRRNVDTPGVASRAASSRCRSLYVYLREGGER